MLHFKASWTLCSCLQLKLGDFKIQSDFHGLSASIIFGNSKRVSGVSPFWILAWGIHWATAFTIGLTSSWDWICITSRVACHHLCHYPSENLSPRVRRSHNGWLVIFVPGLWLLCTHMILDRRKSQPRLSNQATARKNDEGLSLM